MAAKKKQTQIVVTKKYFETQKVVLEIGDKKYDITELKRKKKYKKKIYGPVSNTSGKAMSIPYKQMKCDKIDGILPISFLKKELKINNISFFVQVNDENDDEKNDDKNNKGFSGTLDIPQKYEGFIEREYQSMVLYGIPAGSGTHLDNTVSWGFEYPIKNGKFRCIVKKIKKK